MLRDLTPLQKTVVATLAGVVVLAAGAVALGRSRPLPPQESLPGYTAPAPAASLTVYVTGAVRQPGLWVLPKGARLAQAVEAAGGLTPEADATGLNLARPLRDGQHVVIPQKEPASLPAITPATVAPLPPSPPPASPSRPPDRSERPGAAPSLTSVNLNAADAARLARLPGISAELAEQIVAYRTAHGGFRRVEELLLIPGMTPARLEQLRPYLTL
jgi:competence protein ComEA